MCSSTPANGSRCFTGQFPVVYLHGQFWAHEFGLLRVPNCKDTISVVSPSSGVFTLLVILIWPAGTMAMPPSCEVTDWVSKLFRVCVKTAYGDRAGEDPSGDTASYVAARFACKFHGCCVLVFPKKFIWFLGEKALNRLHSAEMGLHHSACECSATWGPLGMAG